MKLTLLKEAVYGKVYFYPSCEASKCLLKLFKGRKAFRKEEVRILRDAGFELEIIGE